MEAVDVSGMLTGIAAIIGALAALMTAIVAFKNSKKPVAQPAHFAAPAAAPAPQAEQVQYVQGIPKNLQPKRAVSTTKLILRFVIAVALLVVLSLWFDSLYFDETPLGYTLAFAVLGMFFLSLVYGIRLLYRVLVTVFIH